MCKMGVFRRKHVKGFSSTYGATIFKYFLSFLACEQEMESLFVNEYSNSSLRVLKPGDEKAISILNNWKSCEFDSNHSWYFGCSDSRLSSRLYLETMINLFTLTKGDYYYNLKVRNCSCIHVNVYARHLFICGENSIAPVKVKPMKQFFPQ